MNGKVIRAEPANERAVLEAARLWYFTPPLVKGQRAVAIVKMIAFDPGRD
jgi:hypothetical protein